ncbi:MAG: lysophospholipid acyltransferase family protein [Bacteroidota bacterium]
MGYLLYYLLIKPISLLPLSVTYRFADVAAFLLFRVVGYRKKVVLGNMRASFPTWDEKKLQSTAKEFYRYFCDLMVESLRLFSMPEEEAIRRCEVTNPELLLPYRGKSVVIYGGHYNNWEIAGLSFPSQLLPHRTMSLYSPLKNRVMDALSQKNRTRYGLVLVSRRSIGRYYNQDQPPSVEIYISDQSPSNAHWWKLHWTTFLGRTTSFLAGPERYAVRYNRPVFYMRLRRVKRGHFQATLVPVTDQPKQTEPGFITEFFARELEREIIRDPAHWLWTHRRWKRGVAAEVPEKLAGKPYLAGEYKRS